MMNGPGTKVYCNNIWLEGRSLPVFEDHASHAGTDRVEMPGNLNTALIL